MDEVSNIRRWDELIPEALALIFMNLSLEEKLTVVPSVCKSWERAMLNPCCWQEIDIEYWSYNTEEPEIVDRMLRLLIPRSCGSLKKLCVSRLVSEESFVFIASHAQSLQTLRLLQCKIDDSIIEKAAGMLSSVMILDLSCCIILGAQALEVIGKKCKSLTVLLMSACVFDYTSGDKGRAIAATMPNLKHLQISNLPLESVVTIIENCKQLELLDIRGRPVNLDENLVKRFPKLKVLEQHLLYEWFDSICAGAFRCLYEDNEFANALLGDDSFQSP